jgi:hypothetical protein
MCWCGIGVSQENKTPTARLSCDPILRVLCDSVSKTFSLFLFKNLMAHFYGTIQGNRGEASRLGSKDSGLDVTAASWQGAVSVQLYERDGVDYARVTLQPWHGSGTRKDLYDGPVSGKGEQMGAA